VAEAVEQPVDGAQAELGYPVLRLAESAVDGDGDVADVSRLVRGEGEHVGRALDAAKAGVELRQLGVVGEPDGERGARRHLQALPAAAEQGGESGGPRRGPAMCAETVRGDH